MTCLEAQSNIMTFIDRKLPDDKAEDFVNHMQHCKSCREELEIYYTLIVGMRKLDGGEELPKNFKMELDTELKRAIGRVRKVKRFKVSTFSIFFIAAIIGLIFYYGNILTRVYDHEQFLIKEAQGPSYFFDFFGENIDLCSTDFIEESKKIPPPVEVTNYEKIHRYVLKHPRRITEEQETTEEETQHE